MTEQEAQVLRDTATSAEQNALLNSQKLVKMQENYELVCEILEQMIVGAVNTLDLAREVDRLVQERDAEIAELKSIAYSDDGAGGEGMKLFLQVRTQRRVLEQALKYIRKTAVFIPHEYDHEGLEATTAIQEVLA